MSKSIYEKLRKIPDGYIGMISILFMLIPVLYPLGLPLPVSAPTKGFYQTIVSLPPGSIICIDGGGGMASWSEYESSMLAMLKLLLSRPIKWFSWGTSSDGPVMTDILLKRIDPAKTFGKVYGKDYLTLGYIGADEMTIAAVAANTHSVASVDFFGKGLSQYPLWNEVNNAKDFALIISISGSCTNMDVESRQWNAIYGKKILEINMACCSPMSINYFPSIMPGGLWGAKGGTELEVLSGFPGPGARLTDASNLGLIPFIVFLLLGNIGYIGTRYLMKEGEETKK